MKRIKGKCAALIALTLGVVCWGFIIASTIAYTVDPNNPADSKVYLFFGFIVSVVSVIPFVVEGILSVVRAVRWSNRRTLVTNSLSALLTLGLIPMIIFTDDYVWLCYYGIVFVAEIVLLIPYFRQERSDYLD